MITMAEAWWQSGRHGIGVVAESLLLIPQDGGRGRDILRLSLLWALKPQNLTPVVHLQQSHIS